MGHVLTIELPPDAYEALRKMAEDMGQKPEEVAAEWLTLTVQRIANDPLQQLAGTLTCDIPDVGTRHDEFIGQALLRELRGEQHE
jgi:hypothetical protein